MRMKKRKRNPILMKTAVKKKTKEGRETEKTEREKYGYSAVSPLCLLAEIV